MLFKKVSKFWYKMPETCTLFSRKLPVRPMLFKSSDEKRIYWNMNFKKNNLKMKKEFLRYLNAFQKSGHHFSSKTASYSDAFQI